MKRGKGLPNTRERGVGCLLVFSGVPWGDDRIPRLLPNLVFWFYLKYSLVGKRGTKLHSKVQGDLAGDRQTIECLVAMNDFHFSMRRGGQSTGQKSARGV